MKKDKDTDKKMKPLINPEKEKSNVDVDIQIMESLKRELENVKTYEELSRVVQSINHSTVKPRVWRAYAQRLEGTYRERRRFISAKTCSRSGPMSLEL